MACSSCTLVVAEKLRVPLPSSTAPITTMEPDALGVTATESGELLKLVREAVAPTPAASLKA